MSQTGDWEQNEKNFFSGLRISLAAVSCAVQHASVCLQGLRIIFAPHILCRIAGGPQK